MSSFIAAAILTFRCFIIWDRRFIVILVPGTLLSLSSVIMIAFQAASLDESDSLYILNSNVFTTTTSPLTMPVQLGLGIPMVSDMLSHLLLTGLIAGKILFVFRETRSILGRDVKNTYYALIAVVIESGIIFPIALLALFVFRDYTVSFCVIHIDGIAPAFNNRPHRSRDCF
ncbi:hypothetical protein L218DRAFT_1007954 [Marasmius fiardii PR-910]|nr:hypothetical protein L218DRAFT_1007954 [Marasmius fiardii PR-910]